MAIRLDHGEDELTEVHEINVTLAFSIDRDGHVTSPRIAKGSGYVALDDEAMALVMRAQPMPGVPASMTEAEISLTDRSAFRCAEWIVPCPTGACRMAQSRCTR